VPRDVAPLTNALDAVTPGDRQDIYTLLAAWDQSIDAAVAVSGNRFRSVMHRYFGAITFEADSGWAREPAAAYGWGIGHPERDVLDQDFPKYWDPETELDYAVTVTDDQRDRLLAVLSETVEPNRLRQLDDASAFDLTRAAEEYSLDGEQRSP